MSKEPNDQKSWTRELERRGWTLERGGKHVVKMRSPTGQIITLPAHKRQQYGKALNAAIRRQASSNDQD